MSQLVVLVVVTEHVLTISSISSTLVIIKAQQCNTPIGNAGYPHFYLLEPYDD